MLSFTEPRSTIGNESDCRPRGREFDPGWSHTFLEIDHEIIFYVHSPHSADSRRVGVSYK